jgi:hypothetical protein
MRQESFFLASGNEWSEFDLLKTCFEIRTTVGEVD